MGRAFHSMYVPAVWCVCVSRFYHTNQVRKFMLKRPFHRGQKTKDNEYKVSTGSCLYNSCGGGGGGGGGGGCTAG